MKPTIGLYQRRLAKLKKVLDRLGDIPIEQGIEMLWDTEDEYLRKAFLGLSGWDEGWILTEWSRLPRALKQDLFKVRVIDALERAEQLMKRVSG